MTWLNMIRLDPSYNSVPDDILLLSSLGLVISFVTGSRIEQDATTDSRRDESCFRE